MPAFGYFLSCEELSPRDLLTQARLAEHAGFERLAISDHFHPWTDAQGSSPFVWSMIGALSQAVPLPVTTLVTCPTVRIHPAVVAQAAATSAVLTGGGFRLGVGTGEALNEHILGDAWPPFEVRAEMLEEAITVMRRLFAGGVVDHRGPHYTVDNARLYTLPDEPAPIYVSAFGPKSAALAGRIGDGLVTMQPDRELTGLFADAGGVGKPVVGGLKVCFDRDRDRAVRTARELWGIELLPGELNQVLPTPQHFEQAAALVTDEMVEKKIVCGDKAEDYVQAIQKYVDAGFTEVYVSNIGPRYQEFFDFYRDEVLPQLRSFHAHSESGTAPSTTREV
jgi:G6PDH family F420-dependent oxidoreductase